VSYFQILGPLVSQKRLKPDTFNVKMKFKNAIMCDKVAYAQTVKSSIFS